MVHYRIFIPTADGSPTVGTITRIVRHELASVGKSRIPRSMPARINSVPMTKGLGESIMYNLHKAYPQSLMLTILPQVAPVARGPCLLIYKARGVKKEFGDLQPHGPDTVSLLNSGHRMTETPIAEWQPCRTPGRVRSEQSALLQIESRYEARR